MTDPWKAALGVVLDLQRQHFRGYVVVGPQGARVCCGAPGCPAELRATTVELLLEDLHLARWRDDQRLRGWLCPEHAP